MIDLVGGRHLPRIKKRQVSIPNNAMVAATQIP